MNRPQQVILWAAVFATAALILMKTSRKPSETDVIAAHSQSTSMGGATNNQLGDPKTVSALEERRERDALLTKLQTLSHPPIDAKQLVALIPELNKFGLLQNDKVQAIFERVIAAFPVEDLSALALAWPSGEKNSPYSNEFRAIAKILADRNSPDQLLTFINAIPVDHQFRGDILFRCSQYMDSFGPKEINAWINQFTEDDKTNIAKGLAAKIKNSIPDQEDQLDLIDDYLKATTDKSTLAPLIKLHFDLTAKNDPVAALQWVRSQDQSTAEQLDEPIIRALAGSNMQQAVDYVNEIMAGGASERSGKALEYMISEYSKTDSVGALKWVLNLPASANVTDQMIVEPFLKIKSENPEKAKEIMDNTQDPKTKELLTRMWKFTQ